MTGGFRTTAGTVDWGGLRPTPEERLAFRAATERRLQFGNQAEASALRISRDGLFTFGLFTTMVFIQQLGTLGALSFVLLTSCYLAARWRHIGEIFIPRAFLLAIPTIAVISVLWSEAPNETLKYSIEYGITIIAAIMISAAERPKAVMLAMFFAIGLNVAVSLAFGQDVAVGAGGETAFSGLSASKNLIADIAAVGALVSAATFLKGLADRKPWESAVALVVGGVELFALVEARSAGAVIGLALAGLVLLVLLGLRTTRFSLRALAIAFSAICLVGMMVAYQALSDLVVEAGTRFFDKDPTLTGRTYLWQRAFDLIAEKPFLGKGFHAFWLVGNPDAEGLWRYTGVSEGGGFSFHNTAIELLVTLGWCGLIVFAVTLITGAAVLVGRFVKEANFFHCFWLSVLTYELVRTPIEIIGLTEFFYPTVLVFAALGFAFASLREEMKLPAVVPRVPEPYLRPVRPVRYRSIPEPKLRRVPGRPRP